MDETRYFSYTILFQSTRPVRGGTAGPCPHGYVDGISIHPPRAGRDDWGQESKQDVLGFQSTRPVRGGTAGAAQGGAHHTFQSTRPVRGGTLPGLSSLSTSFTFQSTRPVRGGTQTVIKHRAADTISIHPPRAGRDIFACFGLIINNPFQSTRPVRGGTTISCMTHALRIFQSTRPVRGGTVVSRQQGVAPRNFNPPAPCGAGLLGQQEQGAVAHISIHPPRAGRDMRCRYWAHLLAPFQSTRPVRGGTRTLLTRCSRR